MTTNRTAALDRILNRLDTEDSDEIRADLIDEALELCDLDPSLADRARAGGIPA